MIKHMVVNGIFWIESGCCEGHWGDLHNMIKMIEASNGKGV